MSKGTKGWLVMTSLMATLLILFGWLMLSVYQQGDSCKTAPYLVFGLLLPLLVGIAAGFIYHVGRRIQHRDAEQAVMISAAVWALTAVIALIIMPNMHFRTFPVGAYIVAHDQANRLCLHIPKEISGDIVGNRAVLQRHYIGQDGYHRSAPMTITETSGYMVLHSRPCRKTVKVLYVDPSPLTGATLLEYNYECGLVST